MKFISRWVVATLAIYLTVVILPGINASEFSYVIWAGLALGLLNVFLKPILVFFTLPATIISLGLFILVINAFILYLVGELTPIEVSGFWSALFGALLISIFSSIFNAILFPEDRKLRFKIERHR